MSVISPAAVNIDTIFVNKNRLLSGTGTGTGTGTSIIT